MVHVAARLGMLVSDAFYFWRFRMFVSKFSVEKMRRREQCLFLVYIPMFDRNFDKSLQFSTRVKLLNSFLSNTCVHVYLPRWYRPRHSWGLAVRRHWTTWR